MNSQEWEKCVNIWTEQYPVQDIENKHLRLEIELSNPSDNFSEIPVDFNPNNIFFDDPTECFYVCDDWSTIFEVMKMDDSENIRMLVESCHENPQGERIRLMSTSCSIVHKLNEKKNSRHDFAFFRGKFWKLTLNKYHGEYPEGKIDGLPFKDKRHLDIDSMIDQAESVVNKITEKSFKFLDRLVNRINEKFKE